MWTYRRPYLLRVRGEGEEEERGWSGGGGGGGGEVRLRRFIFFSSVVQRGSAGLAGARRDAECRTRDYAARRLHPRVERV